MRRLFNARGISSTPAEPKIYLMKLALRHAQSAYKENELPVGCILVQNGLPHQRTLKIISAGSTKLNKSTRRKHTSHAEVEV